MLLHTTHSDLTSYFSWAGNTADLLCIEEHSPIQAATHCLEWYNTDQFQSSQQKLDSGLGSNSCPWVTLYIINCMVGGTRSCHWDTFLRNLRLYSSCLLFLLLASGAGGKNSTEGTWDWSDVVSIFPLAFSSTFLTPRFVQSITSLS